MFPANIYLIKVINRNTIKRCGICLKVTIKTPERRHSYLSSVFIVNFEHIWHFFSSVSIVDFEQVNISWVIVPAGQAQPFKHLISLKYVRAIWSFSGLLWTNYIVTDTRNLFTRPFSRCCMTVPASDFWTTEKFFRQKVGDGFLDVHATMSIICYGKSCSDQILSIHCFWIKKILPKCSGLNATFNTA